MSCKLSKMMLFSALGAFGATCTSAGPASVEPKNDAAVGKGEDQATAAGAASPTSKRKLLNAKKKVLSNGLEVIVVKDKLAPRISVGVLYHVGSADDPENLVGISHMTEHMLFHGTGLADYDAEISACGGDTNAFTGEDFTMYVADCLANALPRVLALESARMAHFRLDDEKIFRNERQAVREERRMCVENRPLGLAMEYFSRALSPQHPYGLEIIGLPHQIDSYSRADVMDHYHRWYKPNNATLLVIGDVEAAQVFSLAQKYFGAIPRGPVPERKRMQNTIREGLTQEITYYSGDVAADKVMLFYWPPHHKVDGIEECCALQIGLDALFSGPVFSFARYFIDKRHLVSEFSTSFNLCFDPSPLVVDASLFPGVTSEKFLEKFRDKMASVLKNGLSPRDFQLAKKAAITAAVYTATDGQRKMRMLLSALAQGRSIESIEQTHTILETLTLEQVNAVLRKVFGGGAMGVVRVKPKASQN